jgi:carbonic anhydrase
MHVGAAMKIAKYVVIAQMALSVILVVVFVTRSNASNRQRVQADDRRAAHAAETAASDAHAADKGKKADKGEHGEAHEAAGASEGDAEHAEGDNAKPAAKGWAVAQAASSEGGELKLDVKPEGKSGKAGDDHGRPGKAPERDSKGHDGKGHEAKSHDAKAGEAFGTDPKAVALNLLAGNARFVEGHRNGVDMVEQRVTAAGGQHPGVMVLGCADSRVPPELIFDRGVGEMFVVRSAGNIAEPVAVGSLEYAAEHLHTKVLLVLGHEKCGAVQAALSETKMASPNLEAMVEAILPAVRELKAWVDGEQLIKMAVEANVRRQADEVMRRSPILRQAVARKELTVLKAVYDLKSGHVRPL